MTDITIPNVGESVAEVTIAQWFKKPGDAVKKDEPLVELETDKAAQELVAPEDGVLEEIMVAEGENAAVGALIARLGEGTGKAAGAGNAEASKDSEPADKGDSEVGTEGTVTPPVSAEAQDIVVPNVGESVAEVTVAGWMVQVGDVVEKDQPLVELETDKAAQELVSPDAGTITEIVVGEGDTAKIGDVLARLGGGPVAKATSKEADKGDDNADGGAFPDVPPTNTGSIPDGVVAMPAAAKMIREKGLDASKITGTGRDGRILKGDVLKAVQDGSATMDMATMKTGTVDSGEGGAYGNQGTAGADKTAKTNGAVPSYSAAAPTTQAKAPSAPRELGEREERVRMSRLRQTIARRLKDAQNTAAMLTTYNEADMSEIMALRSKYKETFIKRHDVKLGFMSFFVKACVQALKEVPAVNAEIDGTDIIYKNFYDISIAVGTPKGLVVPVLRDCESKNLADIEKAINAVAEKARDGNLSIADMQGGTFTISNGGVYGSLMSSPILNPPQSGILGMHKIEKRPVVVNDEIVIRPMMYLALSYDHRIVDGKEAVTFLVRVKECLEDPERLLLEL